MQPVSLAVIKMSVSESDEINLIFILIVFVLFLNA